MLAPIELFLFLLLIVTALAIAQLRDLFAAAMLTGIFSLLCAGLFTLMDAVDVAFTEAAVGAGIATVLLLGALSLSEREEKKRPFRVLPVLVVVATGCALLFGTLDMPAYGDPSAPIQIYLAPDFIRGTEVEFGLPNIVTAVLASYRGYDTLGETAVIFTAAVGVMLLLLERGNKKREDAR